MSSKRTSYQGQAAFGRSSLDGPTPPVRNVSFAESLPRKAAANLHTLHGPVS